MSDFLFLMLLGLAATVGYALGQLNAGLAYAEHKLKQIQSDVESIK